MNVLTLFGSFFITLFSFILAILVCFGSTTNDSPLNRIYAAQLDISNINFSTLLNIDIPKSGIPSLDNLDVPSYFNLGIWSYCMANSEKKIYQCTKPAGIRDFDLQRLLEDNFDNNEVTQLVGSIIQMAIPKDLKDDMDLYNSLMRCMAVTLVIGIALMGLAVIVNVIRWLVHRPFINLVGRVLALLSFLSMGISAGTSTGTYVLIKNILKDNYKEYGIKLTLGRNFYALLWASVVGCLANFVFWIFTRQNNNRPFLMRQLPTAPIVEEKY